MDQWVLGIDCPKAEEFSTTEVVNKLQTIIIARMKKLS